MSKFDFLDKLDVSTEDFKNEFNKVILWNEVALNGKHDCSPAAIERQYGLCLEEYKEFVEAVNTKDLVEVVDALCDLFVVTSLSKKPYRDWETPVTCNNKQITQSINNFNKISCIDSFYKLFVFFKTQTILSFNCCC